ncbi:MAG TPA: BON domain-containing protein [Terriglobales bacterium]|jgi:hyperosmotically inducible protein|nr:BON domain-containing protein [Terriglobales bacterium]
MRKTILAVFVLLVGVAFANQGHTSEGGNDNNQSTIALPSSHEATNLQQNHIAREVLHELLMLPYYSVFDDLRFTIDPHNNVTLMGEVVDPSTKSDAEGYVKGVQGVESVKNEIQILPPSPQDQEIRIAEYRAIYGFDGLTKYSWSTIPSIHIIVKGGRVRLEGVVDNDGDKTMAGLRANSVPGVFGVENDLRVVPQAAKKK